MSEKKARKQFEETDFPVRCASYNPRMFGRRDVFCLDPHSRKSPFTEIPYYGDAPIGRGGRQGEGAERRGDVRYTDAKSGAILLQKEVPDPAAGATIDGSTRAALVIEYLNGNIFFSAN